MSGRSTSLKAYKVAVVWRGDAATRAAATPQNNRFHRIFEELAALGIEAEPAVYDEAFADDVRDQLLAADGVLVWVDPISEGRTRFQLDAMLRDVADRGVWVSTHPDVTQKMGVKTVLHVTRQLDWGTDTRLYPTDVSFREQFPERLRGAGARVIKQNRGNGGQGVWKVERVSDDLVSVLEARRGSVPKRMPLAAFMADCAGYFADGGCLIDQPFQARLRVGMIRCYMGADRVVGFGHQRIKALLPPPAEGIDSPAAQPGPRIMHPAVAPEFQALRQMMETEWTPQTMQLLGIAPDAMPLIWDADFLYGPKTRSGDDTYVLCEINVSCVMPIPDQAPAAIARLARERLSAAREDKA